jgi:hypothetical protein
MSYAFFKTELEQETKQLTYPQATLLGMYNCEKIIDLYELVTLQYKIGDYPLVRRMGDYIWDSMADPALRNEDLENAFADIQALIPDGEKYHGVNNALALNAIICLDVTYNCLRAIKNQANLTGLYVYDTLRQIMLSKVPEIKFITKEVVARMDATEIVSSEIKDELMMLDQVKSHEIDSGFIASVHEWAKNKKYSLDAVLM